MDFELPSHDVRSATFLFLSLSVFCMVLYPFFYSFPLFYLQKEVFVYVNSVFHNLKTYRQILCFCNSLNMVLRAGVCTDNLILPGALESYYLPHGKFLTCLISHPPQLTHSAHSLEIQMQCYILTLKTPSQTCWLSTYGSHVLSPEAQKSCHRKVWSQFISCKRKKVHTKGYIDIFA